MPSQATSQQSQERYNLRSRHSFSRASSDPEMADKTDLDTTLGSYMDTLCMDIDSLSPSQSILGQPPEANVNIVGNPQPSVSTIETTQNEKSDSGALFSLVKDTVSQVTVSQMTDEGRSEMKKRRRNSPLKTYGTDLTESQMDIAEKVFSSMTKVLEGYLEGFKTTLLDKIRTDYDNALERHRDELQIISNMHKQELDLLEEELKITKDQNVIMEGRLIRAEKEIDNLKEQYLITEAQSMRDNLMFYNIPESSKGAQEDASKTLKSFLADEMRINDEELKQVRFDRVHHIGQKKNDKPRVIVPKFNPSYGKNIVMRHCKNLDRTKRYGVNEQLPRELEERKKHLLPKFREARDAQQKPKWSMDKLIVNDRVTQMKQDCVRDINLNTTDIAASMKIESAPHRTYRKSTFQGHHTAIRTQDDIIPALHAIYALSGVASANHNIYMPVALKLETK